jgi:aspartyl/glutamyl-tRNA(Asn/Gln) amidotransferase B subunit
MFCGCSADYWEAPPNSHVCPVCLAMPGVLPVINAHAVEQTVRTGLALNCQIAPFSVFARKNYHYPDLPKGYQISQYELPLCHDGWLLIEDEDGQPKRIGIRRAHLEEDTGKSIHVDGASPRSGSGASLIDLNRAGVPLLEIVTEADMSNGDEAYRYLVKLRTILRYLGVNSGDMEKGAMRCEVNLSLRTAEQAAAGEYGVKVEVKNLKMHFAINSGILRRHTGDVKAVDGVSFDIYEGDFGVLSLHVSTYLAHGAAAAVSAARGYVLDMDLVSIGFNRKPRMEELEDRGGGRRGFCDAIFGVAVSNPQVLGKFAATA